MALQTDGIVVKNERIDPLYFLLTLYCPSIANEMKAGQFIMLKVSENSSPLLRRPFSVYKSYSSSSPDKKKRGELLILYKIVGKGTRKMAEFKKGQEVNIIGPLGNGFSPPLLLSSAPIILIGGGIGIVSLYPLAEILAPHPLYVFIGAKTKTDILCEEDFKNLNPLRIFIATEDGSLGYRGTVVELFSSQQKSFKKSESPYIYSCGPVGMLKALAKAVKPKGLFCQASFEARMGCGFGACWGCVVKTDDPNTPYQRVCREGPVFNLKNIVWE